MKAQHGLNIRRSFGFWAKSAFWVGIAACHCPGLGGTEQYRYDALGRLSGATFANGSTIEYAYDPAGNRRSVGPAAAGGGTGTFAYVSGYLGTNTSVLIVKNVGTATITGIAVVCTVGGSSVTGTVNTTLAPSATMAVSSYHITGSTCGYRLSGTPASNSPFQHTSF
jgi:hypothetical protein